MGPRPGCWADAAHERNSLLLNALAATDARLAADVQQAMFTFEDLQRLDPKAMRDLLREIQTERLTLALKGASETLMNAVFAGLSSRAADLLKDDLELLTKPKKKDIEAARKEMVEIALRNSLNPSGEPVPVRYRLRSTLVTNLSNLGIQAQGLATLGKLDVFMTYYLTDLQQGNDLLVNKVHVANTFDLNPNQYSTTVGEDDVAVRSVAELNQEIVTRLTLFFERRIAEQKANPG